MSKHIALGDYVRWTGSSIIREVGSIGKVIGRTSANDILKVKWQNGEESSAWLKTIEKVEVEDLV